MNTKKFKERLDVGSNLEDVYRRNGCEYKSDLDPDICHPGLKKEYEVKYQMYKLFDKVSKVGFLIALIPAIKFGISQIGNEQLDIVEMINSIIRLSAFLAAHIVCQYKASKYNTYRRFRSTNSAIE